MPRSPKAAEPWIKADGSVASANAETPPRPLRGRQGKAAKIKLAVKPVALTVKVDQGRYEAVKVFGARTRRSTQEILLAALDAYLRGTANDGPSNVQPAGGHLE
jgi:hypothetical protein